MEENNNDYCTCKEITSTSTEQDFWGYWEICNVCGKKIEDGFHYENHYDGEDHDDIDLYN